MEDLFKKLSINPINDKLYERAFCHSSYAYEHNIESYERLEFLGDALLEIAISEYLYKENRFREGEMTRIRASYVCEDALYEYANDLGLSKYIKVGIGEGHSGGKQKKAIMADVFESLTGAMYLDLGFEKSKEVVLNIIVPYINNKNIVLFSDYKSALQEAVQTDQKSLSYELVDESGPAHNKQFVVVVKVDDIVYGKGIGNSKKEAEQLAAHEALKLMAKN